MAQDIGQSQSTIVLETQRPGFVDLTDRIAQWVREIAASQGLLTLFIRHTSASLTIQENADPDVLRDLETALDRFAPRDLPYRHATEGPDDMPAHIKSMLTSTALQVPVDGGRMLLGTWQAVYLIEHRDAPHQRQVVMHYNGTYSS